MSTMTASMHPLLLWTLIFLCILSSVFAIERRGDSLREVEARVVSLAPGNPGTADVLLQWQAFDKLLYDDGTQHNVLSTNNYDTVIAYEVQSTLSGTGAWAVISDRVSGMSSSTTAGPRRDRHKKQRIFTRVDAGETITDGVFRLALSHAGLSPLDIHTVTPPIAFDASESNIKAALETLNVVSNVQVSRHSLDAAAGTYEWTVVFDQLSLASQTDHGDLPLLSLDAETISATYSGPGDQVAIQSLRDGTFDGVAREDDCVFTVNNVRADQTLAFRVRAHFESQGWSQWSRASEPLVIPPTPLPRAPTAPELLAATTSRLMVQWTSSDSTTSVILFPVVSFHLQQKCNSDLSWRSVERAVPPGRTPTTVATSTPALRPNTSCSFRVAATNANGVGPFSAPSPFFRTHAAAPSPPRQLVITRVPSLRLTWQPPVSDGGSQILGYDIEIRTVASSTWIRVFSTAVDIQTLSCNLSLVLALAPYTRHVARVRARNAMGTSVFVESVDFLTDYRVASSTNATVPSTGATIVVTLPATRQHAANSNDLQYIHGIGNGGQTQSEDGEPGVVLLFPMTFDGERLSEQVFHFVGGVQTFRIPQDNAPRRQIVALDVYAWGGGGGSGDKAAWGTGGGGAFARGIVRVAAGDTIQLLVGGGGQGSARAGRGGWHGGGDGGVGGFPGGGGGGASEVQINNKTVVVAAGGGGGGTSDYCCAHGGGGGASGVATAEDGLFADANAIPLDSRLTGITRNEYHSINVQGDLRDFVGLPARHNHVDYGFAAASADFTTLATGGRGASSMHGGSGGQPASYAVAHVGKCFVNDASGSLFVGSSLAASQATPGRRGHGGKGQDGHDCGGGGGGGYFGGGGGGAGIDGAGGGGGSSFVTVDLLFTRTTRASTTSQDCVASFTVQPVTSTSVSLTWQEPLVGYLSPVQGINVEMANRSANENFRLKQLLPATAISLTVDGLLPASWYRFRVKPLFRDVTRGGYSEIRTVQTPSSPINTWRRVRGMRAMDEQTTHAGVQVVDALPSRWLPSARRGHSLTAFDDGFLYLFGGWSGGYACNQGHKAACVVATGVNHELWRFDTRTRSWRELATLGGPPPAREKHTMAVVASHLLLFGGRQGGVDDATASLNDLWSLKISSTTRKTTATLQNRETNLGIRDGGETFTVASVGQPPDMCVADMIVTVDITHACAQTLRIELLGPGPSTHPQRQQSATSPVDAQIMETTWSDTAGIGVGQKRTTSSIPSARSFPVMLQQPTMASSKSACLSGRRTLSFGSSSSSSLAVFRQLSAAGGWTLSVLDTALDGNSGTLNSWDIAFTLVPCVPTWTWTNVGLATTGAPPTPRFQHAAIVYQSSMFIVGGRSATGAKPLVDLYRLDYNAAGNTGVWTTLMPMTTVRDTSYYHGRVVLLTPYQLLTIGQGLHSRQTTAAPHTLTSGLYIARKSITETLGAWQSLAVNVTPDDRELAVPLGRYWSSAAFTGDPTPRVYLYGGQDDTALLSDLWLLRLDALVESEPSIDLDTKRLEICSWRLGNIVLQQKWTASCGASAANVATATAAECSLDTLLQYAWCTKTYQSIQL